jgi:hypothetical protein
LPLLAGGYPADNRKQFFFRLIHRLKPVSFCTLRKSSCIAASDLASLAVQAIAPAPDLPQSPVEGEQAERALHRVRVIPQTSC